MVFIEDTRATNALIQVYISNSQYLCFRVPVNFFVALYAIKVIEKKWDWSMQKKVRQQMIMVEDHFPAYSITTQNTILWDLYFQDESLDKKTGDIFEK